MIINRVSDRIYFVLSGTGEVFSDDKWEKGVVVKDTLNAARQSYHAYLGAYGYGHAANTDYVACYIFGDNGANYDMMIDDRRPAGVSNTADQPESSSALF